jgi:hypothetical protein
MSDAMEAKLDVVIKLLALQVGVGSPVAQRIALLKSAGMDTALVADVLGTTPAVIRARASDARRKPKKARRT